MRLYLLGSPIVMGNDIAISEEEYKLQVRETMLLLWNSYKFFVLYAVEHGWKPNTKRSQTQNVLDKWVLARIKETVRLVTIHMDSYETPQSVRLIKDFINDLSSWYIRRSRERFALKNSEAFETLYEVFLLLTKIMAPISPFISEEIYRNLTGDESVHLTYWPEQPEVLSTDEKNLLIQMDTARKLCEKVHAIRKSEGIKVRQPLSLLTITGVAFEPQFKEGLETLLKDELNVKNISYKNGESLSVELDTKLTDSLKAEGEAREIIRAVQNLRKQKCCALTDAIIIKAPAFPEEFKEYILQKTLASDIKKADTLDIELVKK